MKATDTQLAELLRMLPTGRQHALPGSVLAHEIGISPRTLRELVGELIDRGELIGSTCSGEAAGYFRCADRRDVEVGCGHLISRARSMLGRVRTLRRAAERQMGPEILTLFDLEASDA